MHLECNEQNERGKQKMPKHALTQNNYCNKIGTALMHSRRNKSQQEILDKNKHLNIIRRHDVSMLQKIAIHKKKIIIITYPHKEASSVHQ